MRFPRLALLAFLLMTGLAGAAPKKQPEAAPAAIEWMTEYNAAIKAAQESGKLLLIYNGWKDKGI